MLLEMDCCDIIQPDVGWCGGITELIKIATLADAHGVLLIPHGSSVYSYHFAITRHNSPFSEFLMMHPTAEQVVPMFHPQLIGEPVPVNGRLKAIVTAPDLGSSSTGISRSIARTRTEMPTAVLSGIVPMLPTPFDDSGRIEWGDFAPIISHQLEMVLMGSLRWGSEARLHVSRSKSGSKSRTPCCALCRAARERSSVSVRTIRQRCARSLATRRDTAPPQSWWHRLELRP